MKCAMELIAIANEAKIQKEIQEQARQAQLEQSTIAWCESTLAKYLEKQAMTYSALCEGRWTFEFGAGNPMHFDKTNNILRPLEEGTTYANGNPSWKPSSIELRYDTIIQHCKKHCFDVLLEELDYPRWGFGVVKGIVLKFRITPECLNT